MLQLQHQVWEEPPMAIHGPMPISGESSDTLSQPLVHADFPWKQGGGLDFLETHMDQWLPSLSESSGIRQLCRQIPRELIHQLQSQLRWAKTRVLKTKKRV